ncbi:MAG: RNA 2',3'-cyclic phosphodiesterase, partial [Acetobacteraceae bacterium]
MSVFLGWMPDENARRELGILRDGLRDALPAGVVRHQWRTPAQWHATLRYLGEDVDDVLLDAVRAMMPALAGTHAACDVVVEQAQYWPGARVLVAALSTPTPLRQLHADLEHAMRELGFGPEKRALKPHVTLAHL